MKKPVKLTGVELKIMRVLWEREKEQTIQEIAGALEKEKLSPASVTQAINRLVKKGAAKVRGHVLVSNVYARTFSPCFTQEEFMAAEYERLQKDVFGAKRIDRMGIAAAFLGQEELSMENIQQLQGIIDEKRKKLMEKENG